MSVTPSLRPIYGQRFDAQITGDQYPAQTYYVGLEVYRSGDLQNAADVFEDAMRGSRRDINGRWIDAIPSLAMLAECSWHLGDLVTCKQFLDEIGQIAIRNRGWLGRSQFQEALQAGVTRSKPRWLWPEAAAVNLIPVNDRIRYRQGDPITEARLQQGGTIQPMMLIPVDIAEVMRTLALASYRRRIVMGQLAAGDDLAAGVVDATKFPAELNVDIGVGLITAMRTAEYFAAGNDRRTKEEGVKVANAGGAHPLTAIALLTHASALAGTTQPLSVLPVAATAANTAGALRQPELVGEAMQLAAGCTDQSSAASVTKLAGVAANSLGRESRLASLHCLIAAADASITAGDLESSGRFLTDATTIISRRDVVTPRLGAYLAYVRARLAAQSGASIGAPVTSAADVALGTIRGFALNHRDRRRSLVSMPRLFQMSLVRASMGVAAGGRTADNLLTIYGGDPALDVWRRDPVDALSTFIADRAVLQASRVGIAASQGYAEPLLLAIDTMLAGRFLQGLPLGGRLSHVRTLASGDENFLPADVIKMRAAAGPNMKRLRQMAIQAGQPGDAAIESMESLAATVGLDRANVPAVAIPMLDTESPTNGIAPRTGLLTFASVGKQVFAVLATSEKVNSWAVPGATRLPSEIGRVLREIGVGKPRGGRVPESDEAWRKAASVIANRLFPDAATIDTKSLTTLMIVPDGPLWYLPFELLPMGDADADLLGDLIDIRYAPTPGLALNATGPPASNRTIGIAAKQFFAPRELEQELSMVDSLIESAADPLRLPDQLNVPTGLLGDQVGHLVIASAQGANVKNPLATPVAPYDANSNAGSLAGWLRFPAAAPRTVVSVGVRTPVDIGQMGTGNEIFMQLCALHVAGVRDILMSRWAVGGESSAMMLREIVQELPFGGLDPAWKRAKAILRESELDPTSEPLLNRDDKEIPDLSGNQPLFWAGYLHSTQQ